MLNNPLSVWQFYCLMLVLLTMQLTLSDPLYQQRRQIEGIIRKG